MSDMTATVFSKIVLPGSTPGHGEQLQGGGWDKVQTSIWPHQLVDTKSTAVQSKQVSQPP